MIPFLFTLKGLCRVLKIVSQSDYKVNAAEVEGAATFVKMSRSWAVKKPCPWPLLEWHYACHSSVFHTKGLQVNDIYHHIQGLNSQELLGRNKELGTRACTPSTGICIPCRWVCLVLGEAVFSRGPWDSSFAVLFLRPLPVSFPKSFTREPSRWPRSHGLNFIHSKALRMWVMCM